MAHMARKRRAGDEAFYFFGESLRDCGAMLDLS